MHHKQEVELTDDDFKVLVTLVHEKLGIVLASHKKSMVYRRLSKRLSELNMQSFGEYIKFLMDDAGEVSNLANAITTNLTSFFRENHHFEHLEALLQDHVRHNKSLRIWSAGCSNGCEPYSIAMVLNKVMGSNKNYDAKILATDIDTNMLSFGSAGIYDMEWIEKIPSSYKTSLTYSKESAQINHNIRQLISFKKLNLLSQWPIKNKFDIIFCRNVVIYFDKDTQRTIFNKFADLMHNDAHLYIGHSENLMNVSNRFLSLGKTIYKRIA